MCVVLVFYFRFLFFVFHVCVLCFLFLCFVFLSCNCYSDLCGNLGISLGCTGNATENVCAAMPLNS